MHDRLDGLWRDEDFGDRRDRTRAIVPDARRADQSAGFRPRVRSDFRNARCRTAGRTLRGPGAACPHRRPRAGPGRYGLGLRYGRPVRLGKNPALPRDWITRIVEEACRLLEHLSRNHPFLLGRPQLQVLR